MSCVAASAKQCTAVFNCIDYGGMFDYAVNSLCKSLRIPYITVSMFNQHAAWNVRFVLPLIQYPMFYPYVFSTWHGPIACAKMTDAAASVARRQREHLA